MGRLRFNDEIVTLRRPRRAAHALDRRLALCRWWLVRYLKAPRGLNPQDVLDRIRGVLAPERPRMIGLASMYERHHRSQRDLFDPVSVLLAPPTGRRLAPWLRARGRIAARTNAAIARAAKMQWDTTRDPRALVTMVVGLQLDVGWVHQAVADLQGKALGDPSQSGRDAAAQALGLIGDALLKSGRGRLRGPVRQVKRAQSPQVQARYHARTRLPQQITRRVQKGARSAVAATQVLERFAEKTHRHLNTLDKTQIVREVGREFGLPEEDIKEILKIL